MSDVSRRPKKVDALIAWLTKAETVLTGDDVATILSRNEVPTSLATALQPHITVELLRTISPTDYQDIAILAGSLDRAQPTGAGFLVTAPFAAASTELTDDEYIALATEPARGSLPETLTVYFDRYRSVERLEQFLASLRATGRNIKVIADFRLWPHGYFNRERELWDSDSEFHAAAPEISAMMLRHGIDPIGIVRRTGAVSWHDIDVDDVARYIALEAHTQSALAAMEILFEALFQGAVEEETVDSLDRLFEWAAVLADLPKTEHPSENPKVSEMLRNMYLPYSLFLWFAPEFYALWGAEIVRVASESVVATAPTGLGARAALAEQSRVTPEMRREIREELLREDSSLLYETAVRCGEYESVVTLVEFVGENGFVEVACQLVARVPAHDVVNTAQRSYLHLSDDDRWVTAKAVIARLEQERYRSRHVGGREWDFITKTCLDEAQQLVLWHDYLARCYLSPAMKEEAYDRLGAGRMLLLAQQFSTPQVLRDIAKHYLKGDELATLLLTSEDAVTRRIAAANPHVAVGAVAENCLKDERKSVSAAAHRRLLDALMD